MRYHSTNMRYGIAPFIRSEHLGMRRYGYFVSPALDLNDGLNNGLPLLDCCSLAPEFFCIKDTLTVWQYQQIIYFLDVYHRLTIVKVYQINGLIHVGYAFCFLVNSFDVFNNISDDILDRAAAVWQLLL